MLEVDKELQAIADKKSANDIMDAADAWFALDVDDCDNDVGARVGGLEVGLELAAKAKEGARFFKITFSDYDDDDGVAVFVGTRETVETTLKNLDDEESEDDDEC